MHIKIKGIRKCTTKDYQTFDDSSLIKSSIMPHSSSLRQFSTPSPSGIAYLPCHCRLPFPAHLENTFQPTNWGTGNTLSNSLGTPFSHGIAGGWSEPCAFSRNEQPLMVGWPLSRNTQGRGSLQLSQLFMPVQQLGKIWSHNGVSVLTPPNPVLAGQGKHHPTEGQALNYNGALQSLDI